MCSGNSSLISWLFKAATCPACEGMGSKAATAGPQLMCVLFCLAALSNISPAQASAYMQLEDLHRHLDLHHHHHRHPEVTNILFGATLSHNIHASVQDAYLASIQETSPDSVVTRHAFLMSVAGKTTARLTQLYSDQDDAGQLIATYAISVFIWDVWAEDAGSVVTKGLLAGRVKGAQASFKDSGDLALTAGATEVLGFWDWEASSGGSMHETVDVVDVWSPALPGSSSHADPRIRRVEVMVYLSDTGEKLFPPPAKQLWREASADALKLWNSLPVYLPGITSSAYKSWKSGMELVYGDAAAGRIRGVHVCAAEACGFHAEHLFMQAHAHTGDTEPSPELIMALLPEDPGLLPQTVVHGM